jgi:hypothetical protein
LIYILGYILTTLSLGGVTSLPRKTSVGRPLLHSPAHFSMTGVIKYSFDAILIKRLISKI